MRVKATARLLVSDRLAMMRTMMYGCRTATYRTKPDKSMQMLENWKMTQIMISFLPSATPRKLTMKIWRWDITWAVIKIQSVIGTYPFTCGLVPQRILLPCVSAHAGYNTSGMLDCRMEQIVSVAMMKFVTMAMRQPVTRAVLVTWVNSVGAH
jgi:hypothetical protein